MAVEGKDMTMDPSQPACPAYSEVMARTSERLDVRWKCKKSQITRGRIDTRFLAGHSRQVLQNLLFLPDLYTEVERSWK